MGRSQPPEAGGSGARFYLPAKIDLLPPFCKSEADASYEVIRLRRQKFKKNLIEKLIFSRGGGGRFSLVFLPTTLCCFSSPPRPSELQGWERGPGGEGAMLKAIIICLYKTAI